MSINRAALRKEAKRLYKEQVKNIPKKQRLSFSKFFKQYKNVKAGKVEDDLSLEVEESDFDFENMININEISDDDIEAPQVIIKDENKEL